MGFQNLTPDYHNVVFFMLLMLTIMRSNFKASLVGAAVVASATRNVRGNETDRLALLAIKAQIVDGPFLVMTSWNESLHFCQWKGVSCGRRHNQRVTQLNLASHRLEGQISPSIGNLSFVRVIELSNNNLQGEIPSDLSRLYRLRLLGLSNNSLVGKIPPNLSFCSDLRIISLDGNNLTGQIPPELGLLSRLSFFSVMVNILKGNIPPHLGNLSSSLQVLRVADNRLEGHVPASLGRLENLNNLQLSGNFFSGTIPRSVYNLSRLNYLYMARNRFEGKLPWDIGLTLPNIEAFIVWENRFSGPIPASFANASNLVRFQISINSFVGGVPNMFGNMKKLDSLAMDETQLGSAKNDDLDFFASLTNCTNIRHISLIGDNFGGTFPSSVANLSTQLEILAIGGNPISGIIPPGVENLRSLNGLGVFNTLLSGTIPTTIGKLDKLQRLELDQGQFSGEIPSSLGNLTLLLQLLLGHNKLQGRIPSSLGNCTNLLLLDLSSNALNGTIPQSVISLPSLSEVLNLSRNHFVGSLPSEVGELVNLGRLDVSHNRLSSAIPPSLGGCTVLRQLYMDHNFFEGSIPESLSELRGIEEIDLSHNNLSGQIPKDIDRLVFLSKLDLSFNDLEGEMPTGVRVFGNASAISVSGNPKLCGGIPQLRLQSCSVKKPSTRSLFRRGEIIIPFVFGVLAMALIFYLLFSWWFRKERKEENESSPANPFASISYGDLLKATDGFASENLIGVGSIGSVYKGILEADQTAVAVKVFNLQKRGASKSFAAECETLRGVRHRNLVKVITACSSIDYQGNEFKALVYELMPNGNLENLLHPSPQTEDSSSDPLTMSKRVDIAIDVALVVDYLHNHVETPILHCDLKPSNILLDHDNIAHVGDFGLSRIVPQDNAGIPNNQSSSSGLKGTVGYAAPEYGMGSKVSKEGDMYSFGILLLEMFTGKRPTDNDFGEEMNLNQFVKSALPERVMEVVDQGIIPREDDEATSNSRNEERRKMKICECCVSVLRIGVICSDEFPRARMKIDEALKQLYVAKKMLL